MATETREGTWDQLRLSPAQLMRLVIQDKADVVGKDRHGRLIYRIRPNEGEDRDTAPGT